MGTFHVVSEPPRVIKVLIAEDNRTVATQMARILDSAPTKQFMYEFAEDLVGALAALQRAHYHVVLLDLGLPDSDGLQTFVRLHEHSPKVPVVVCTGVDDEALAVEALRRGAQDYLVKGQLDRMALIKSVVFAVERRHAAEKLRESEEMHRNLLESIPDIVCQVNIEGTIVFANRAVSVLGYDPKDLMGAPLSRLVHRDDASRVEARVMRHLARASWTGADSARFDRKSDVAPGPFEIRYVTREGEPVAVDFSAAILRNRRGEATGIVGIARDVTEMKRLILDLEDSREQLRQRTAQLIHTEKMTALGELAAGVAHEANQPLNAIKLACGDVVRDIDKARLDEAELSETLSDMVAEVDKLADLIQHMSDFSRRTSGSREVLEASIPVDGAIKLMGEQLRVEGVRLVVEVERGLRVKANAVRLQQVLMNLLANARDAVTETFTEAVPKIAVRVYPSSDDDAGRFVVYEVTDNGPGIPEPILPKVFEPFFTTKKQGQGTGLGLSIVEQIVEEHGGRIELECPAEGGTLVRVLVSAP